ncbi:MFS transporter [Secundilactobacillus paracollinoides]|uniref:MFS transporter n=1 Tax=Secundilactobacillus paracollinoides TaxID=240427 RepID=A0A1B2IW27_9LACO|nr:MFS transporter [Secundilactobacillus paracollinoides]ANZ60422.1 MFS transporter [Secundilactobacillus paracollinoides]ANZ66250.1 MFS transporter [Secundilactobacillus paracollinoides]
MKNRALSTSAGMYLNYLIVGMSIIILPQNMDVLAKQWQTNLAGVAVVISAVGLGRVFVSLVSGVLSDKLGRRLFIILGGLLSIVFFLGELLCTSLTLALIFAIIGGIGGAFLDSGTYPALMELFPEHKTIANVTLKAFASIGQFTLPLVISFIVAQHLWYGWSFIMCIAVLAVVVLFITFFAHFPVREQQTNVQHSNSHVVKNHSKKSGNIWIDGLLFAIFGYTADGVFLLVSIWITKYGQEVVGMNDVSSRALVSYYSVGSISCVLLTIWLSHRGVKDIQFLLSYMAISFVSLLVLYLFPTPVISTLMAFIVGFSAAGGVMQIGITVMGTFFPNEKGTATGIITTASAIAGFTVNLIAGALATNLANVILFDVGLALIGFISAALITIRYHHIFDSQTEQKTAVPLTVKHS